MIVAINNRAEIVAISKHEVIVAINNRVEIAEINNVASADSTAGLDRDEALPPIVTPLSQKHTEHKPWPVEKVEAEIPPADPMPITQFTEREEPIVMPQPQQPVEEHPTAQSYASSLPRAIANSNKSRLNRICLLVPEENHGAPGDPVD